MPIISQGHLLRFSQIYYISCFTKIVLNKAAFSEVCQKLTSQKVSLK